MRIRLWLLGGVLALVLATFGWHQPVNAQAEGAVHLTFEDLGYSDMTLAGLYGSAYVYIPFQSNWIVEEPVDVEIAYIASTLLSEERTTLTVLANGAPVGSIYPSTDGEEHTISLAIPMEYVVDHGFWLGIEGNLAMPPTVCPEVHNPAQWVTILGRSTVTIIPTLDVGAPDLSDLQASIVVQNAIEEPPPVIFVFPDAPDETAMTVAGQVAARLGNGAGGSLVRFRATTAGTLTSSDRQGANLVVIGLPEDQPLIGEMAESLPLALDGYSFRGADGATVPPDRGVIQIVNSPWNPARRALVVSAGNDAGLQVAGGAFADSETFQAFQGAAEVVDGAALPAGPVTEYAWLTSTATFTQLGLFDRNVNGTGVYTEYFPFRLPPGWVLDSGAQLTLHITSSPALYAGVSHIAIFLNSEPVGVVRTGEGFEENEVTFDLPVAQINGSATTAQPQEMILQMSVANFLHEVACEQSHPDSSWTTVLADSSFTIPHSYLSLPDLQAFPYPFVSDQDAADTVIVLPPQPTSRELAMALSLAASLGRFAPTDFRLSLYASDQIPSEVRDEAHLIVLGTRSRQPWVDELLDSLPSLPESVLNGAASSRDAGLLREEISPWNQDRVVLLVYADTGTGLESAVDGLFNAAPPVTEPGTAAVAEGDSPLRVIFRPAEAEEAAPEEVPTEAAGAEAQPGAAPGEQVSPMLRAVGIATAVIAVSALVVLAVLWFRRRFRQRDSQPPANDDRSEG